jgi:hypothetical protein
MGRPKKERKFLHILSLNSGAGTYLTTFATPSKGRGSVLFERIVNISLCVAPNGLFTPGFEPRIPSPLAGEGQGEGNIK